MTQDKANTAVVPDSLKALQEVRSLRNEAVAQETGVSKDEAALADLTAMDGWAVLRNFIHGEIDSLEKAVSMTMASGASFEAIGAKAIVATTVKEKLLGLIEYVEAHATYVQSRQRTSS